MNRIHRWLCASAAWKKALDQNLLPWVLDGVDLGGELLEVGPGPGLTTEFLRRRVERIAAVEIDARLAESLGRRMANTNVGVVRGDATHLPFRDASFSAAVSLTMLHHVPSELMQDRLLGEVCRVLRPNGIFAGMDSTGSMLLRLLHLGDTMVLVDPDSFGSRLQRAGFAGATVKKAGGRFRFLAVRPS